MEERRREPRIRSLLGGRMTFNDSQCAVSCTVRNVSETGAMVKLTEMFRMPDEFDLNIPHHDETLRAKIIWRKSDAAGLALSPIVKEKPENAPRRMWMQGGRKPANQVMTLGY